MALRTFARALDSGSGYWCSAGHHAADQAVSWTGALNVRRKVIGLKINWAYSPGTLAHRPFFLCSLVVRLRVLLSSKSSLHARVALPIHLAPVGEVKILTSPDGANFEEREI